MLCCCGQLGSAVPRTYLHILLNQACQHPLSRFAPRLSASVPHCACIMGTEVGCSKPARRSLGQAPRSKFLGFLALITNLFGSDPACDFVASSCNLLPSLVLVLLHIKTRIWHQSRRTIPCDTVCQLGWQLRIMVDIRCLATFVET